MCLVSFVWPNAMCVRTCTNVSCSEYVACTKLYSTLVYAQLDIEKTYT